MALLVCSLQVKAQIWNALLVAGLQKRRVERFEKDTQNSQGSGTGGVVWSVKGTAFNLADAGWADGHHP